MLLALRLYAEFLSYPDMGFTDTITESTLRAIRTFYLYTWQGGPGRHLRLQPKTERAGFEPAVEVYAPTTV